MRNWNLAKLIFPMLIVVSLALGSSVHAYYDWTGSDQSRPAAVVPQTAIVMLLVAVVACAALPWLPIAYDSPATNRLGKLQFQFKIRTMLLVTALIAIVLAFLKEGGLFVAAYGWYGIVFCYAVYSGIRWRPYRLPLVALMACMYFPFAWLISYKELSNLLPELITMVAGLPAFIFLLLASSLIQQHPNDWKWLSILFTGIELAIGIWMIHLGAKRAIAYFVFTLLASIFGSFIFNALVRA